MRTIMAITVCAMVLAFTVPASALLGLPETLEGTVESIGADTLAIISETEATQKMVEIRINAETQFEEVASLDNLKVGDKVKVTYKEEDSAKIALSVAKIIENVPAAS